MNEPKDTAERQDHIIQFFAFVHLPPKLRDVAEPFALLARSMVDPASERWLPRNPERTVALRKLLEAKDAAVRAALALPEAG